MFSHMEAKVNLIEVVAKAKRKKGKSKDGNKMTDRWGVCKRKEKITSNIHST